jgi:hypothetical protein
MKTYNGMRNQTGHPSVFIMDGIEVQPLSPQLRLEASQTPTPEFEWGDRSLAAYSLSIAMCIDATNARDADLRRIITSSTAFDFMDRVVCQLPFWRWSVDVFQVLELLKSISKERGIVMGIELAQRHNPKPTQENHNG